MIFRVDRFRISSAEYLLTFYHSINPTLTHRDRNSNIFFCLAKSLCHSICRYLFVNIIHCKYKIKSIAIQNGRPNYLVFIVRFRILAISLVEVVELIYGFITSILLLFNLPQMNIILKHPLAF